MLISSYMLSGSIVRRSLSKKRPFVLSLSLNLAQLFILLSLRNVIPF